MGLSSLGEKFNKPDVGLFLIRVCVGLALVIHSIPKWQGGFSRLKSVGEAVSIYGIEFGHTFWGVLAASVESVGGLLIALGLFFRPAAFLLFLTMLTAFLTHGPAFSLKSFFGFELAWVFMWVFLGLLFTGPGKYCVGFKS